MFFGADVDAGVQINMPLSVTRKLSAVLCFVFSARQLPSNAREKQGAVGRGASCRETPSFFCFSHSKPEEHGQLQNTHTTHTWYDLVAAASYSRVA